jgi:hypothetical protein
MNYIEKFEEERRDLIELNGKNKTLKSAAHNFLVE